MRIVKITPGLPVYPGDSFRSPTSGNVLQALCRQRNRADEVLSE